MMNKHKKYFDVLNVIKKWSRDPSTKVSAIIVNENGQIISQGYNGFPNNINETDERWQNRDLKYKFIVHAEANALMCALRSNVNLNNSSIYISGMSVCNECAKLIAQSGIKNVFMDTYPNERWIESWKITKQIFDEAKINYEFLKD